MQGTDGVVLKVFLGFIGLAIVLSLVSELQWAPALLVLVGGAASTAVYKQRRAKADAEAQRRRTSAIEALERVIREHAGTLMLKRHALIVRDAYGKSHIEKWAAEKQYFVEHVLAEDTPDSLRYVGGVEAMRRIETVVDEYAAERASSDSTVTTLSPGSYEELCAQALKAAGWDATRVGGTGDQGVDVLASVDGRTVVVQCKWYSKPVGNSAVQEVVAGRHFYSGDKAIVVAPNGFTDGAISLAHANGVVLTHHSELHRVREWL